MSLGGCRKQYQANERKPVGKGPNTTGEAEILEILHFILFSYNGLTGLVMFLVHLFDFHFSFWVFFDRDHFN